MFLETVVVHPMPFPNEYEIVKVPRPELAGSKNPGTDSPVQFPPIYVSGTFPYRSGRQPNCRVVNWCKFPHQSLRHKRLVLQIHLRTLKEWVKTVMTITWMCVNASSSCILNQVGDCVNPFTCDWCIEYISRQNSWTTECTSTWKSL